MKASNQYPVALVGIGNQIAGDDAAGIVALEQLQKKLSGYSSLLFLTLQADLYDISDHLDRAGHFIFIDAVAGREPGQILRSRRIPRAHTPSLHQTDIGAVMAALESLEFVTPFPSWEIWGISIIPPTELNIGLTAPIQKKIRALIYQVARHVRGLLQEEARNQNEAETNR